MKIAVIGAGWAGLAAAYTLQQQHQVTVFEAAKHIGGRARPINTPLFSSTIDNGQHILIGAYQNCFSLMRKLNIEPSQVLQRQTLNISTLNNSLKFRFLNLPAPWNRLGLFFASSGLEGIKGRLFLLRLLKSLKQHHAFAGLSVHDWLLQLNCPPKLITNLWQPLCIASMNTDIHSASASSFAAVINDGMLASSHASDIYIPKATLHDLWPAQVAKLLGEQLKYRYIRSITANADQSWQVADSNFDQVILATPAHISQKIIAGLPDAANYLHNWPAYKYSAIGTLSLLLEKPWLSGQAMHLLQDNTSTNAWGQWLFDRSHSANDEIHKRLVHVVIGCAQRYAGMDIEAIKAGVIAQIQAQAPKPLPRVIRHLLVTEKRATFDAVNGLNRPANSTPWPDLYLAGDWTDTKYPAVLEGAVISGLQAAELINQANNK